MDTNPNTPDGMEAASDVARAFAARAIRDAFGGAMRTVDVFGDVIKGDTFQAVAMVAATRGAETYAVTLVLNRRGDGYAAATARVMAVGDPSIAADMLDAFQAEGE